MLNAATDIYLAGPLFTLAEREFNAKLAQGLRERNLTVFLPQETEVRELTSSSIFANDVNGVDQAKVVVAIFDGPDPDSGTCWECGYAYAKGKPIIAVRTDFRNISDGGLAPYNLMLWESAKEKVELSSLFSDLPSIVNAVVKSFQSVEVPQL